MYKWAWSMAVARGKGGGEGGRGGGGGGAVAPRPKKSPLKNIEQHQKPKDVLERLGSFLYGDYLWKIITCPELASKFQNFLGERAPNTPSDLRPRRSFSLPPPHNFCLATAMRSRNSRSLLHYESIRETNGSSRRMAVLNLWVKGLKWCWGRY